MFMALNGVALIAHCFLTVNAGRMPVLCEPKPSIIKKLVEKLILFVVMLKRFF